MENKGRNLPQPESSLLLQLPNSMYSFNDSSGASYLMPVAVQPPVSVEAVGTECNFPNSSPVSEKHEVPLKSDTPSVCQLEQPLLMRKTSPGPPCHPAVSQIDSNVSSSAAYLPVSVQAVSLYSGSPVQPATDSIGPTVQTAVHHSFSLSQEYKESYASEIPQMTATISSSAVDGPIRNEDVPVSSASFMFAPASCIGESYNMVGPPPDYYSRSAVPSDGCSYNSEAPVYYTQTAPKASLSSSDQSKSVLQLKDEMQVIPSITYELVKPYWLFQDTVETKEIWYGFSKRDSESLESAFLQDPNAVVPTDGRRYDAYLGSRLKRSVYFEAKELRIRRCTWFYQSDSSNRFLPFEENKANEIEKLYFTCVTSGEWAKNLNFPGFGSVFLESPQVMLLYKNELVIWPSAPDCRANPKVVKRGLPEGFEVPPDESDQIDHLVFIVQGIGSFCDLRFRTVSQCVDGFRDIANKLLASHFKHEVERGQVGRVEFLPLAWHAKLHKSNIDLDRRLKDITLPSIPKLRHFTNDTLLDILLYSSPSYCQSIIDTVASELNTLYEIFLSRNLNFSGNVYVAGHSLGSLILFDILSNQKLSQIECQSLKKESFENKKEELDETAKPEEESTAKNICASFSSVESLLEFLQLADYIELFKKERVDLETLPLLSDDELLAVRLPIGPRKKLLKYLHSQISDLGDSSKIKDFDSIQAENSDVSVEENLENIGEVSNKKTFPMKRRNSFSLSVQYPRLHFEPACFFALGSPISMFLAVRGYDSIREDFRFPTCPAFFHIFHPYDPVAFRFEPLINSNFTAKPVLIPHHKGRKRMHLEIRENLTKVGSEIKQKVLETLKYTWDSLSGFAKAHTFPSAAIEVEVDKLVKQQMSESEDEAQGTSEASEEDLQIGSLNGGRRIDYVLQEKPIEALNDYIFALTSHATYWDSEDTVLMILREIYAAQGIVVSSQPKEMKSFDVEPLFNNKFPFEPVASNAYASASTEMDNRVKSSQNIPQFYNSNQTLPYNVPFSSTNVLSANISSSKVTSTQNSRSPSNIPVTQPVGPPPLTGFVKRSAFSR